MKSDTKERMLHCPNCNTIEYPKICPAVITAVRNGNKLLLSKYAGREYVHYALIAGFTDVLTVVTSNGEVYTVDNQGNKTEGNMGKAEADFPTSHIYSTNFDSNNQSQAMVVGRTVNDVQQTIPWVSSNGKDWYSLANTSSYDVYCPKFANPAVMYYGENFYIFGSKDENKLDAIYSSVDGISWREPQRKFLLHKDMTDITAPYSIVADSPYTVSYTHLTLPTIA